MRRAAILFVTMSSQTIPRNLVITGESGSGKTILCERIAASAREQGCKVSGVLTLPQMVDGRKIGIEAQDLRTGERRQLARRSGLRGPATETWQFNEAALAWGALVLRRALPTDLFVVDELGPLELERAIGWVDALHLLCGGAYKLALVVVRPALVDLFRRRVPIARTVQVTPVDREERFQEMMAWVRGLDDSR